MKKRLIVTGHDFGLCHSVNEGFLYALNQSPSILTELALIVNAPGSLEAAEAARKTQLSVSLNFNITSLRPLSSGLRTLVDPHGDFYKPNLYQWDFSFLDQVEEGEVVRELEAQWDFFVREVGRKPSAILSRKGEHGDPKVLLAVVEKAKKEGVAIRTPAWRWKENYAAQAFVEDSGVRCSQNIFIGCLDWQGRFGYDLERDVGKLINDINQKEGVSELFIFVGFADEELFALSSHVNWQRGQYLQILRQKAELLERLRDNFELIGYDRL